MPPIRTLIMGAAGRDFHNFNVFFRGNRAFVVVAFTAAQIPNIECRMYPPVLAGDAYPAGIPIHPEADLDRLIREQQVEQVVFAYSDQSHEGRDAPRLDRAGRWSRFLFAGAPPHPAQVE